MGIGRADNAWWLDVLEWGEESPYAEYFDIDWSSAKLELRGKVLLPVLGNHYGDTLEGGELKLAFDADDGSFSVWYYEHRFPVTPGQYSRILRPVAEAAQPGRTARATIEAEALEVVVSGLSRHDPALPLAARSRDAASAGGRAAPAPGRGGSRTGSGQGDRGRGRAAQRHPRQACELRAAAPAARGAAIPARLLARRGRGDQLSPVLPDQRSGRASGSRCRRSSTRSTN